MPGRYAKRVRAQGGMVAIVDIDCNSRTNADWLFEGDAAEVRGRAGAVCAEGDADGVRSWCRCCSSR